MEVFYSTPTRYMDAVMSNTNVKWTVKTDDFFPYADNNISYWTGEDTRQWQSCFLWKFGCLSVSRVY